MSLYQVNSGQTINSGDVNQLVNTLQAPAGAQESGKYHLLFNASGAGSQGQCWIQTLSRTSIPVSVTIDTADNAPSNCNAPATSNLKSSGFQIFTSSTTGPVNCNCGGNYTVQYIFAFAFLSASLLSALIGFAPHFI